MSTVDIDSLDKKWKPHVRGGIVGNYKPLESSEEARDLSNAMARDGHYPAGLSVCFTAGINGDSPNHCLFAFTDDCVCTEDEKSEWTFTSDDIKDLIATQKAHLKAELLAKMPMKRGGTQAHEDDTYGAEDEGYNQAIAELKQIIGASNE